MFATRLTATRTSTSYLRSLRTQATKMEKITFGDNIPGYFYAPPGAKAGVIVIQEWWGVNEEIKAQAEYIAKQKNFMVLVPDLYKGKSTLEKEEAHHLMSNLDFPQALKEIAAAAEFLKTKQGCAKVGITGFCMGGALTFGAAQHANVDCAAPYYGFNAAICDLKSLKIPILAQFGAEDKFAGFSDPETAKKIEAELVGKDAKVIIYPGADHGFLNGILPEAEVRRKKMGFVETPSSVREESWKTLLAFFEKHLA